MPRALLKLAYAPLMLLLGNSAALAWVGAGQPAAWLAALLLVAIALSFAAERLIPYEDGRALPLDEARRDVTHAFANETLSMAGVSIIPALSAVSPLTSCWPSHWPLVLQWLLAVLVADAGITLTHYASHHVPWLWRLHAVHHSAQRLYGLNGLMKHPLHQLIETTAGVAPLLLLGLPQQIGALLAFSVALQLLLQHANVDMRLGPLRHLLALAPMHRFHHQKWAGVGDVNFGLFTTLWDRLLGTAIDDPNRRFMPDDFGIGTRPDYPQGYLAQLVEPFRPR